ncbi:MAG: GspE/PulE family protein [Holophagales bacterium]|jgi:type IV pilus assembly protein PilB|nr:GspE/PulE family protein [Holophagales bacterium]
MTYSGAPSNSTPDLIPNPDLAGGLELTLPSQIYPTLDLTKEYVDFTLFQMVSLDLMLKHHFVPVQERDGCLWVAMADPLNVITQDLLRRLLKRPLKFAAAPQTQIQEVLKKSESGQKVLDEAGEALSILVVSEDDLDDEVLDLDRLTDKDEAPIIRLVDTTVFNALQRRASDIHMESAGNGFHIKYRIDGSLYPAADPIDRRFASPIISRIKVMSELDIAEKRKPQDGRFKLKVRGRAIDFRVSIMPTIHGEDAVIRILDKENLSEEFRQLNLDILGFQQHELLRIRRFAREPYGMFLVTGPTGSGKTTTLYAILSEIRSPEDKLITIEDPVEYQLEGVTQIPVNEKKGLTFALGLRSILRHDPDKILVGEIRDNETAQIAIQSALTGHLVFTTVHANNTLDVLGRFQHMGVEVYNFVSALNCVLAQRLVRVLCPKCKKPIKVSEAELRENGIAPDWAQSATLYDTVGCVDCNGTGYRGRQAIVEFMGMNDELRELITNRASVRDIKAAARKNGMQSLRESAIEKVRAGTTTFKEINKVTFREG